VRIPEPSAEVINKVFDYTLREDFAGSFSGCMPPILRLIRMFIRRARISVTNRSQVLGVEWHLT
ncbi:MAG TPA: hypothetical protein VGY77_03990, partial [Gemmataceae bacterium]|nr:hypothetical protein [Gemmataceae bacterium]